MLSIFKRIKTKTVISLGSIFLLIGLLQAQETVRVDLSSPGERVTLEISLINGGIKVTGVEQDFVEFQFLDAQGKTINPEELNSKRNNYIKIDGWSVDEKRNSVTLSVHPWVEIGIVELRVPVNTDLNLNCTNDGDIIVNNVDGEMDVHNINGGINLKGVLGPVVAHSLNQSIYVDFNKISSDGDMSITTLNGDIEISMPDGESVELNMKTQNGVIKSQFPLQNIRELSVSESDSYKGKYKLTNSNHISAKLNGGGPLMTISTMNGDVVINKAK